MLEQVLFLYVAAHRKPGAPNADERGKASLGSDNNAAGSRPLIYGRRCFFKKKYIYIFETHFCLHLSRHERRAAAYYFHTQLTADNKRVNMHIAIRPETPAEFI